MKREEEYQEEHNPKGRISAYKETTFSNLPSSSKPESSIPLLTQSDKSAASPSTVDKRPSTRSRQSPTPAGWDGKSKRWSQVKPTILQSSTHHFNAYEAGRGLTENSGDFPEYRQHRLYGTIRIPQTLRSSPRVTPTRIRPGSTEYSSTTLMSGIVAHPPPPARRHSSQVFTRRGTATLHHHFPGSELDLLQRTSSKLTLDEELYDILYAFGYVVSIYLYLKEGVKGQKRKKDRP